MSFKKKTPDLITLYFYSPVDDSDQGEGDELKVYKRLFRVSKRQLFLQTLQVNSISLLSYTFLRFSIFLLLFRKI